MCELTKNIYAVIGAVILKFWKFEVSWDKLKDFFYLINFLMT
jgi:hypothetical protein